MPVVVLVQPNLLWEPWAGSPFRLVLGPSPDQTVWIGTLRYPGRVVVGQSVITNVWLLKGVHWSWREERHHRGNRAFPVVSRRVDVELVRHGRADP